MAIGGSPGNQNYLPSSSSWGLPTAFDFSQNNAPHGMLAVLIAVVGLLILMHIFKGGKRR